MDEEFDAKSTSQHDAPETSNKIRNLILRLEIWRLSIRIRSGKMSGINEKATGRNILASLALGIISLCSNRWTQ